MLPNKIRINVSRPIKVTRNKSQIIHAVLCVLKSLAVNYEIYLQTTKFFLNMFLFRINVSCIKFLSESSRENS